jgi:hypothetical protein
MASSRQDIFGLVISRFRNVLAREEHADFYFDKYEELMNTFGRVLEEWSKV